MANDQHPRWDPPAPPPESGALSDRFVWNACLIYGNWNPSHGELAARMLAEHPELAETDIHAAAAAGNVSAVRAMLARDPALANARGGYLQWEPLLYACYSRLDTPTVDAARVLLEAGANPNAGVRWGGEVPPFTALTGAFGEGEDGNNQPPHPQRDAMARLLLEAGADPNDGQTLYNRHFRPDDGHLELLFEYGLSDRPMLVEELWAGARKNFFDRVKLLVGHGTDVNTPGVRNGRTPYQEAQLAGNDEIAAYLLQHGASKTELDPLQTFATACAAGRRDEALALLAANPGFKEKLGERGRSELLHRAVESNRPEAIRLMAELGFALSGPHRVTPMHVAAWAGNVAMVQLLVELGADPEVRDPSYDGTPRDWAAHNHQQEVVDWFLAHGASSIPA